VFHPEAKYLYVARDMPDIVWSMHNHMYQALDDFFDLFNNTPGLIGAPLERPTFDTYQYWKEFLENDGYPCWPFWENIRTWWEIRDLPNVKLIHFNDLKGNLEKEIRDIAAFLEMPVDEREWPRIVEHCTFQWMKDNADKVAPGGGDLWENGGQSFINKGENKRWKEVLSDDDIAGYHAKAIAELGEECARWLFNGKLPL
jgi:aryl sulfotransferase